MKESFVIQAMSGAGAHSKASQTISTVLFSVTVKVLFLMNKDPLTVGGKRCFVPSEYLAALLSC